MRADRKGKRNNSILIGEESVLEEGLLVGTLSVGTIPELGKTFAFCVLRNVMEIGYVDRVYVLSCSE